MSVRCVYAVVKSTCYDSSSLKKKLEFSAISLHLPPAKGDKV
jgi:hypothetical protein